jgi:N-acetylglucosamine kinase-like BadF-type ATPase
MLLLRRGGDRTRILPPVTAEGHRLWLGVDGGNTKTLALLADARGTVAGSGAAGPSDIHERRPGLALAEMERAVCIALAQAGACGAAVAGATFSLAGADWPEDFALLRRELRRRLHLPAPPTVLNDAVGAIRCGTADGIGVSVVLGTWGVVGARGRDGELFHIGFGPDSSGARGLGQEALAALYRETLGTGPATTLTPRVLGAFGAADGIELMHSVTRRGRRLVIETGSIAGVVLEEAEAGDAVARAIVDGQVRRLADRVDAFGARVGLAPEERTVVLAGGLLRHPSRVLVEDLATAVAPATLVRATLEPVAGALLLALGDAGAAVEDRVRESAPPVGDFTAR